MSLGITPVAELQRNVTSYSAPKATLLAILDASVGSDVSKWASCTVGVAVWSRKSLALLWRCSFLPKDHVDISFFVSHCAPRMSKLVNMEC